MRAPMITSPRPHGGTPDAHSAGCSILEFEKRSRQLFENAPFACHEANTVGVIVRVNQAECKRQTE
jgi:hypothetical protein